MKLLYLFGNFAVITLVALSLVEIPAATAQAVISNETLVTTTFVVNKRAATAQCGATGRHATKSMFASIPVTCPTAAGKTCTFHISLDTKTSIEFPCGAGM
jgi:hypothetical protein